MNTLRNKEYDCILEATEVSNKHALSFFEKMQEAIINDAISIMECDKLLSDNQKKYSLMLDDSLSQLQNIKVDTDKLSDFFTKTYNSVTMEDKEITIPIRKLTDVEKIRPQYLLQLVTDALSVCNKITNNEITNGYQLDQYTSDEFVYRYKKQLVKTNIPMNVGDKLDVLLNYGKPILCKVNQEFLQTTCMPFLRSYNYNVKELGDTNNTIRATFNKAYDSIKTYLRTVDTLKKSGKLSDLQFSLLRQFLFNTTNKFLELVSYTVFMAIRRINDHTFNLNSFIYLYNEISRYYPEGDGILHESVVDGTFKDINHSDLVFELVRNNSSTLKVVAERILSKIKSDMVVRTGDGITDSFHSVIDINTDSTDYDLSVYENINDVFNKIKGDLEILRTNMKDEFILVDDLLYKSNLNEKLSTRFVNIIHAISNIGCYNDVLNGDNSYSKYDVILTIINELNQFNGNIDSITQNISETHENIIDLKTRLESNINNEFPNNTTREEVLTRIKELDIEFSDLVMQVGKEILDRLHALSDTADGIENDETGIDSDETNLDLNSDENYAEMARDFEFELMDLEYHYLSESAVIDYNNRLMEKKYGISIYTEANEGQQPQDDSKPEKKDVQVQVNNTPEQEAKEVENSKLSSNDNNQKDAQQKLKTKSFINDLSGKISLFFKTIISKFVGMVKKQLGTNKVWLDKYKEAILGRKDWSGISIALDKNYDIEGFMSKVQSGFVALNTNITNLTAEKINSFKSAEELDAYLFSFFGKNTNDVKKDIYTYWFCKDNKEEPVTYQGSGAKRFTDAMVKYVDAYYTSDANALANTIQKTSTTLNNGVKKLENVEPATVRHIASICQYFCGVSMNAQRDATYACLKALKKLVPRNANVENNQEIKKQNDSGNKNQNNTGNKKQDNNPSFEEQQKEYERLKKEDGRINKNLSDLYDSI